MLYPAASTGCSAFHAAATAARPSSCCRAASTRTCRAHADRVTVPRAWSTSAASASLSLTGTTTRLPSSVLRRPAMIPVYHNHPHSGIPEH